MANTAKMAILRAKIEGVVTDLMLKTTAEHVYVDSNTTLATKLASLATQNDLTALQNTVNALGALAKKDKVSYADLEEALATLIDGKAEQTALEAEIKRATEAEGAMSERLGELETGGAQLGAAIEALGQNVTTLIGDDTGKSARTIANEELAKQLIPENAAEALDTLTEIAAWIQSHPNDASALAAAIEALQNQVKGIAAGEGTVKKYVDDAIAALKIGDYALAADLTALAGRVSTLETTAGNLKALAYKDIITESEIDASLKEKINASAQGNHSHANKELLDTYTQTEADLADAVAKKHAHENQTVLDGITAAKVSTWNGKAKVYAADAVVDLPENEIYIQLV